MLLVADCQRIFEKLLWDPAGRCMESVLERLALTDPGKLATIVAEGCLPFSRMCPATTKPTNGADGRSSSADQASAPDGATALPTDIAPALEETVAAHFATATPAGRLEDPLVRPTWFNEGLTVWFAINAEWQTGPPKASQSPLTAPADRLAAEGVAADLIQREED